MSGYIQKFYGNNMFPDNSGKQVWRYYNKTPNVTINYFGGSCGSLWGACGNAWGNFTGHFCGGLGKGGFWRGLGAGVGLGLMNWAIGGFNNLMSPWGMGSNTWGGAFGNNWWNNGIGNGRASGSGKCSCGCGDDKAKACEDKDEARIEKLDKALKNKNLDEARAKELYKEIKELIEEPLDKAHAKGNKITYERLLGALEDLAEDNAWTLEPDAEPEAETETPATSKQKAEEQEDATEVENPETQEAANTRKTNQSQQAEQTQQAVEQEEVEQEEPINVKNLSFEDGGIIDGETYDKLDENTAREVIVHYMSLLDNIQDDKEFRDKFDKLPLRLRNDIKNNYYIKAGYKPLGASNIITNDNLKKAVDTKGDYPRDVEGSTEIIATEGNPLNQIKITDGSTTVIYTAQEDELEDLYVSDRNTGAEQQEYALVQVKDSNPAEYHLVQFRWHNGYGIPDVTKY